MKQLLAIALAAAFVLTVPLATTPAAAQKASPAKSKQSKTKPTTSKAAKPNTAKKTAPKKSAAKSKSAGASPCKGLSRTQCSSKKSCGWITPKKKVSTNGRKLTAYCRKVARK